MSNCKTLFEMQIENERAFELAEKQHIENMIVKWGDRWYRIVRDTEDDCITAEDMRYEEDH